VAPRAQDGREVKRRAVTSRTSLVLVCSTGAATTWLLQTTEQRRSRASASADGTFERTQHAQSVDVGQGQFP
jgi:hypothetical protein